MFARYSISLRTAFAIAAVVTIAASSVADAQPTLAELKSGARIRLRAPAAGLFVTTTAVVDSVGADSLYVGRLREPPALRTVDRLAVPLASITRLEASVSRKSRWAHAGKGALWGLGLYAVAAGVYVAHESATCRGSDCFGGGWAWLGLAVGVPYSAGLGGLVGLALPVERWRPIARPEASRATTTSHE